MLSGVAERKMLSVRSLLLAAWLCLIASLFWDPYSATLTDADNGGSPFAITNRVVTVQGEDLISEPYPLGPRIFWTMAVPILPLFLMVFGHEAWRRICPLSLASQIPGMTGLRRYRSLLERRTGIIRKSLPLIDRQSWLARNSWYVQFSLLFIGVTARLLIINTDRTAMGISLLAVIGMAVVTGFLWGGKTWCNYFCPANIVQKIYTEPGGILESSPHFSRPKLPHSMCRKSTPNGDVSTCVGCQANCGDVDLQRSYWSGILEPQRRNVYYMFFGLVVGFYGYYYLYAGNWDYYFSGLWTHEGGVREKLLGPGFFLFGHAVAIPKLVAAPLTLALACSASLALGRGLESLYRRWHSGGGNAMEKVIVHHCLSVAAWLSFNCFYLFGGRPNILLITPLGGRLVDIIIVALSTIWLRRALQQSPVRYQQESMASSLLTELKKLKVNVSKFLDGRSLDQLKPNEIYLLNKALPGYSKEQKLNAYQKILAEAVTKGTTANSSAIRLLDEFRTQMDISEEEHSGLLDELGLSDIAGSEASAVTAEEKIASLHHYRSIVCGIVASRLNEGVLVKDLPSQESFRLTIDVMRHSLQISDAEHEALMEELISETGVVGARMEEILDTLLRQRSVRLCLEAAEVSDPLGQTLLHLLLDALDAHDHVIRVQALQILRNFNPGGNTLRYAEELCGMSGHAMELLLRQAVPGTPTLHWRDVFDPQVMAVLAGDVSSSSTSAADIVGEMRTHRGAVLGSLNIEANLSELLLFENPVLRAIALKLFSYIDHSVAANAAQRVLSESAADDQPLLLATALNLAGMVDAEDRTSSGPMLTLVGKINGRPQAPQIFRQDYVTIGRGPDNDLVISDPAAGAYHAAISAHQGEVRLLRIDGGKVFIDGHPMLPESTVLRKATLITLDNRTGNAPEIMIDWTGSDECGAPIPVQPVLRLAMVAQNDRLACLSLGSLAEIAVGSRVLRYVRGEQMEELGVTRGHFLIHQGEVRLFDPTAVNFVPDVAFGPGDLIGPDLFGFGAHGLAEVVSDYALIVELHTTPEVRAAATRSRTRDGRSGTTPSQQRFTTQPER